MLLALLALVFPFALLVNTSAGHTTSGPCTVSGPKRDVAPAPPEGTGGTRISLTVSCESRPRVVSIEQTVKIDNTVVFKEADTLRSGGGSASVTKEIQLPAKLPTFTHCVKIEDDDPATPTVDRCVIVPPST